MEKIKMICIKDLTNDVDLWYKIGDFYEYNGLATFLMFKLFEEHGTQKLKNKVMSREVLYEHFMPYNQWLALERENQIDSIFK